MAGSMSADPAAAASPCPDVSIVAPVYNEADNIVPFLSGLRDRVRSSHEILIVYDFDADTTLPAIRAMKDPPATLRLVRNDIGRGVVNALRAGFRAARGRAVIVTMADCSDDPAHVDLMAQRLLAGADIVAGSRYVRGGRQVGGPPFKRFLSRLAGVAAHHLTSMPIHDITTNFRGYSRRVVDQIEIESTGGFEFALELTVKAHQRGWRVEEFPTTWTDRTAGQSRFRLLHWLPRYLKWYGSLFYTEWLAPRRVRCGSRNCS